MLAAVFAGPRAAPGAGPWLDRLASAARAAGGCRAILTGPGLDWTESARLEALAKEGVVQVALCARSAGARRLSADDLPAWVRWSSLVSFARDLAPTDRLWGLFP